MTSPPAPSLGRNAVWALVGNVGYAACQWAVLVVVARLGTAADVGEFALGLALAAPVVALANMGLRILQATDARDESPFGAYLGLRLITAALALAGVGGAALALGYRGHTLALVLALGLAKAVEAVGDVFLGLFQKLENVRRLALSMLARGAVSVAVMAAGLWLTGDLAAATLAMAAGWALVLALGDVPAAARLTRVWPLFDRARLGALVRVALPAGVQSSLGSLAVSIPRFAVERQLGAVALGQFAAMAYALVAATQPVLALGTTVAPRLARHFHTDRRAYRELTGYTVAVAAGLGLLALAATAAGGRAFLATAYGHEYAEETRPLVWLALAAGATFVATALGYAVTAARRIREQSAVALVAVVVCALASAVLVPRHGLVGAAWAVLATETSRLVCLGALCARAVRGGAPAARPGRVAIMPAKPVVDVTR